MRCAGVFAHGARLLLGQGNDGKLSLESARSLTRSQGDLRFPRPVVLSLTQSTEVGTVYSPEELAALCGLAREHGMKVHVDGARLMNACAALGTSPAELSWKCGVDVLSLGASKTGGGIGDTVVFFDRELARGFDYRCKQSGQLAAKMRLITAPLLGLMETGAWLRNARHANDCAAYLAGRPAGHGIATAFPLEANAVFIRLSDCEADALHQRGWPFYISSCHGAARFMCGWDTTREQIDALAEDIRQAKGLDG